MNQEELNEIQQQVERQAAEEERAREERIRQHQLRQQQQAEADAASTAEESNQDAEASNEGLITRIGREIDKFSEGGQMMDATSALGDLVGLDLANYEEFKEAEGQINQERRDRLDANEGTLGDNVVLGGEALSEGATAGVLAPVTVAGRIANQETPWSRAPQAIKDHALYDTIFQVTEVMVPTLIGGGVVGGSVGATGLVAESALETALQDDLGETLSGEFVADRLGEVATYLGYDGEELTAELKDGRNNESKALTAVVGFFENLGINFSVDQVIKAVGNGKRAVTPEADNAARVSGKNPEKVQEAIDDVSTPDYKPDYEPHEVLDVDTVVPTSKPSPRNISVSEDALRAEMLRDVGILDDGLTSAQRNYFSNYKPLAKESGIQAVIKEVTKGLKGLNLAAGDKKRMVERAATFWNENKGLIDENLDDLIEKFADPAEEMVRAVDARWQAAHDAFMPNKPKARLKEGSATELSGTIVAAAIGEELGVKIQKGAMVANNLEQVGIDFSDAVENLIKLQEAAEHFFVPLRRGKRKAHLEMVANQRKSIEGITDPAKQSKGADATLGQSSTGFTRIRKDEADVGKTIREMWTAAQAGDEDALKTLKDYINYLAHTNPRNVMEQVDNLSNILHREFMKGNSDAASNLFYGFMLSRVSTQVASIASNISRLALEPVGAVLAGEQAYGLGQLIGGLAHWQEAVSVGRRAFIQNAPINGGSKLPTSISSLKEQQLLIEQNFQGVKTAFEKEGKDITSLVWSRNLQMAGTNPLVHTGMRLLMSADEMSKSLLASQIATGRAFREAAESGLDKSSFEFKRLIHKHFNDVYATGVKDGKIKDASVLDAARNVSFQREIPRGEDASLFDNLAASMEDAAKKSALARFFVPFTRVSWNIAETGFRTGVGVGYRTSKAIGNSPIGAAAQSTAIGRWVSDQMFPRYRAIMEGTDETAKLQLKSQFAIGEATAISGVGLAAMGMMTGYNSGQLPQTSLIVPAPGTTKGYIAINYSKLEPFASLLALTADGVNSFRYGAISRGEFDKVIEEVTFSLGMASLNKTFLSGIANLGEILNIKNMNKGSAAMLASSIASLSSPAIIRSLGQIIQPYEVLTQNDGSLPETMGAKVNARAIGGVGLPILHSPLTGQPVPRAATIGGDGYWNAVLGSLVNEFGFPGKVQGVDPNDPVIQNLNAIGFDYDSYSTIRNVNGVPLSLQEQSYLARDMGDPNIGNLRGHLEDYFNGQGAENIRRFEELRAEEGGSVVEGSNSHRALQEIRGHVRSIYQQVKQLAASEGELGLGDGGQAYRNKATGHRISTGPTGPEKIEGAEGLVAWARGQIAMSQVG